MKGKKKYSVSIPFRYWETVEVEASSKEEALDKVTEHEFVDDIVKRTHISVEELDWDYNWLDTAEDRVDDVVEEIEE